MAKEMCGLVLRLPAITVSKNMVGVYDKCYGRQLETLLDLHSPIYCKINEIEGEIKQIIVNLNSPTLSVKGIGPMLFAVIVSEFGDISRFPNPNKMLSCRIGAEIFSIGNLRA